jgi:tetratricopeptide (TPR) repeat protein
LRRTTTLLIAALLAAACTDTTPPPPAVAPPPTGHAHFLIDPRTGWDKPVDARFENAWRYFLAGNDAEASRRAGEILAKDPNAGPAALLTAAIDIRAGRLDEASAIVARTQSRDPGYMAANVYAAEIALARHDTRAAYELYSQIAASPNAPPTAAERLTTLRAELFDELVARAQGAPDEQSIPMLREALQINPGATNVRMLLVQRLVAEKNYDEARQELEPILNTAEADRNDVQEALAEIDAGRGRFQEAIVRYERLAHRANEPRYTQRLNELKEQFAAANTPPQYQRAVENEAITRADFAVLLYWKVASIRFAQNLGTPPIAVDLDADVIGREEMIRAMALGIFTVDPVTRRVGPNNVMTAQAVARAAARALAARGAACAHDSDPQRVLAACGVSDPMIGATPDSAVPGRFAATMAEQIDQALSR